MTDASRAADVEPDGDELRGSPSDLAEKQRRHQIWKHTQEWERKWWGLAPNQRWAKEVEKQYAYAEKMGMPADLDFMALPEYRRRSCLHVLDVGCGPTPMLLRAKLHAGSRLEPSAKIGVDPITVSDETHRRFHDTNVNFMNIQAEALTADLPGFEKRHFDEVWMYNCLQHVEDPYAILENIERVGKRVRIFEWIDLAPCPGHPWTLTGRMFSTYFDHDNWKTNIWDVNTHHKIGAFGANGKYIAIDVTHVGDVEKGERPIWVRPDIRVNRELTAIDQSWWSRQTSRKEDPGDLSSTERRASGATSGSERAWGTPTVRLAREGDRAGITKSSRRASLVNSPTRAFAYVTLTDHNYLEVASVMLRSLVLSEPAFPIRVMCFDDVTKAQRAALEKMDHRIETLPIESIKLSANVKVRHQAWAKSFSRLRMFELTQFEKMIFLDADMVVTENIDDLLERPTLSACSHHYPLRNNAMNLNAGVAVFSPDKDTYRRIVEEIIYLPSPWPPHTWELSDQEVLIALYSTEDYAARWREKYGIQLNEQWHLLDYRYNAITGLQQRQIAGWDACDAKVLHYTCGPKPWWTKKRDSIADRIWWQFHASAPRARLAPD